MSYAPSTSWKPSTFPYGRRIDGRFAAGVRGEGNFRVPSLCVTEDDDGYVVVAEIPGVQRDELEVTLSEHCLCVRGQRRPRGDGNGSAGNGHAGVGIESNGAARYLSCFQREIHLAKEVDAAGAGARFENGVLTVTLPVVQSEQARESASKPIQIQ